MEKKWKIAIIVLFLLVAWMRLGPAIKWTQDANDWMARWERRGHDMSDCWIDYTWSWWSLRVVSVWPECDD